jgi:MFS transporter, ACS family, hexuronate transporter
MYALITWFPKGKIGTAGSIRNGFQALGPILCTPLVVAITLAFDWRHAFLLPGAIGLFFGVMWWFTDKNPPIYKDRAETTGQKTKVLKVFTTRAIWGILLARLISDPLWFFLQYWMAGYLQEKMGISLKTVGMILWIPPLISSVLIIILGLFSDRLMSHFGWLNAKSRIRILQCVAILAPLTLLIPYVDNLYLVMALMTSAYFVANIWLVFTNILATDLFRGKGMATAVGVVNAVGTVGATLFTQYVGHTLDKGLLGYGIVFLVLACLHPIAAIILQLFYREQLKTTSKAVAA